MLLAMVDDVRVILVKLADRLHNMRTLRHLPEDRRRRVAQETLDIYAPIAHRLGMSKVKNELEDLAFQHLEPEVYESLRKRVESKRRATQDAVEDLRRTITRTLEAAGVPVLQIHGRIKRLYSIRQKLKRQQIDLEQVYDLVALRIVTQSVKDCYAALGVIHHAWSPVPGRIKDFIAMPRPNGYQALHTSVVSERGFPFEVQIRTEEMHRISEDGIAAHWKYKEGRVGAERDEQYFQWLRHLLEWQQEVHDPHEFIQHLKIDLYPDEVYSFTPRGEVKSFPRGATPIDFAYAIHTDVGHQCVGARVNGKMVALRTKLQNGDIVEIVTSANHTPSRDWLSIVATSRARNRIKHFIQAEERTRSVEIGRRLFEREARRYGLNPKSILESESLAAAVGDYGVQRVDDLLAAIGYGKVVPRNALVKLVPQGQLKERPPDGAIASAVRRVLRSGDDKITVRGLDDVMVFLARCCNPIKGEPIVGYITRGKGVSVHALTCPNVVNLLYDAERRIDVAWDKSSEDGAYVVHLKIQVEDRKGLLAAISSTIAGINTNIRHVEAVTRDDHLGHIDMTLEVSDLKHLERVVKSLRGVDGVLDVERPTR